MPRLSIATRRQRLITEIAELETGNQRRYPESTRSRILDYARRRLDAGASVTTICTEVGVSHPTLSKLLADLPAPMRRVRVAQSPTPTAADRQLPLVVRGPSGIVVEGLGVEGVAELIRTLS